MKKLLILFLLCLVWACGGGSKSDDNGGDTPVDPGLGPKITNFNFTGAYKVELLGYRNDKKLYPFLNPNVKYEHNAYFRSAGTGDIIVRKLQQENTLNNDPKNDFSITAENYTNFQNYVRNGSYEGVYGDKNIFYIVKYYEGEYSGWENVYIKTDLLVEKYTLISGELDNDLFFEWTTPPYADSTSFFKRKSVWFKLEPEYYTPQTYNAGVALYYYSKLSSGFDRNGAISCTLSFKNSSIPEYSLSFYGMDNKYAGYYATNYDSYRLYERYNMGRLYFDIEKDGTTIASVPAGSEHTEQNGKRYYKIYYDIRCVDKNLSAFFPEAEGRDGWHTLKVYK